MALDQIQTLIKQTMGLDAATIGTPAIEQAVRQRANSRGLAELDAYWRFLKASEAELQLLIEAVVVPETWFFRDRWAFDVLRQLAVEEWLSAPKMQYRLLSLPCSTGEEPYSMAMALSEAGLSPGRFLVDAGDISEQSLERAREGVYRRNSFRSEDLQFRDKYFDKTLDGYRLRDQLRPTVKFQQVNLMDPRTLPGQGVYHAIFCRNVLIYFDRVGQDAVVQLLTRLLAPDGLIFVGPAEGSLMLDSGYEPAKAPQALAFRKLTKPKSAPAPLLPRKISAFPAASSVAVQRAVLPRTNGVPASKPTTVSAATSSQRVTLAEASQLANQGRFAEAARICESHLKETGPSPDAFFLLGMMRDAVGRPQEAGDFFRKVLYLQPDHYEAMLNLAYALEKTGDTSSATRFHDRARRLKERISNA
jgi:chemotaxis protein methyltransferase WspC